MSDELQELREKLDQGDRFELSQAMMAAAEEAEPQLPRGEVKAATPKERVGKVQWVTSDGVVFTGAGRTQEALTPGLYDIDFLPDVGLFFERLALKTENLVAFPHTNTERVLGEIQRFWDLSPTFERYGLAHKRGILLWGPPGSGKSCTIAQIIQDVIKRGGVAIRYFHPKLFTDAMKVFRQIQPDSPLVVVMEDLDALIAQGGGRESEILNTLDGVGLVTHTVFLATTNYPQDLGERVVNRPSRFDKRFKIPPPTPESRRLYFEHLIGVEEIQRLKLDLEQWIRDTENLSLAHLKELFVATILLGDPYEDAVKNIQSMQEKISSEDDRSNVMGFGTKRRKSE